MCRRLCWSFILNNKDNDTRTYYLPNTVLSFLLSKWAPLFCSDTTLLCLWDASGSLAISCLTVRRDSDASLFWCPITTVTENNACEDDLPNILASQSLSWTYQPLRSVFSTCPHLITHIPGLIHSLSLFLKLFSPLTVQMWHSFFPVPFSRLTTCHAHWAFLLLSSLPGCSSPGMCMAGFFSV